MWNQRSRALWVKCGDRNTKLLCDLGGQWREDCEEVEGIILAYFKEIYSSNFPVDFGVSLGAVDRKVSEVMNEDLLMEFKEEEVWRALKQMHPTKSSGSDDMSPIFFQKYWDIVGPHVVDCVLQTLRTGVLKAKISQESPFHEK